MQRGWWAALPKLSRSHAAAGTSIPLSERTQTLQTLIEALQYLLSPISDMRPPEAAVCAHACDARQQAAATPAASSEQTPSISGDTAPSRLERPKSARRRAAEALLHRRFSGTGLAALAEGSGGLASDLDGRPSKRQRSEHAAVRVAACSDCCARGCHSAAAKDEPWCAQDVSLPHVDWPAVLRAVKGEADVAVDAAAGVHTLPGGRLRTTGVHHALSGVGTLGLNALLRASL